MVLTGQAKKDYQRFYMRKRSKKRKNNSGSNTKGLKEHPRVSDQDFTKLMAQAGPGHVQVSKPGDADYEPQCETTRAFVEKVSDVGGKEHSMECDPKILAEFRASKQVKRGKDIKTFEDLPSDVQQTIDIMSVVEGKIDQTIKANRTAIAIAYQHTFPERY